MAGIVSKGYDAIHGAVDPEILGHFYFPLKDIYMGTHGKRIEGIEIYFPADQLYM